MSLRIEQFRDFFYEVHEQYPFPWQERLAERVCSSDDWPNQLSLPTGSGKTAVLDVAVFAMAFQASQGRNRAGIRRRVFFVVDRRIVVDEASDRARHIAQEIQKAAGSRSALGEVRAALSRLAGEDEKPLIVASLRGGRLRDELWAKSPLQPLVCCSTVDQIGSALLFRSYGARFARNWPIHAALVGCDSLLIVDEAHISRPFEDTALAIQGLQRRRQQEIASSPLRVVSMSATQQNTGIRPFQLDEKDRDHKILRARLSAPKPALLEECAEDQLATKLVGHAKDLGGRHQAVGVVVNRILTARRVFERLSKEYPGRVLLLIGRCRPWERDQLWSEWQKRIEASSNGRSENRGKDAIWVVATQCIEVGANLDFDALVTEAASLDALRQRFGRVDRLGQYRKSESVILRGLPANKEHEKKDPVYGEALKKTWEQLKKWQAAAEKAQGKKAPKKKAKVDAEGDQSKSAGLDFGIEAIAGLVGGLEESDLEELLMPSERAAVLMPGHLDVLSHTSPQPLPDIEPAALLHGQEHGPADVEIAWRADLDEYPKESRDELLTTWVDLVALLPPSPSECISVPFRAAKDWLSGQKAPDATDLEGVELASAPAANQRERHALLWVGRDDSRVIRPQELKPGMKIVVPASYGGADRYGWSPASEAAVTDLAGEIAFRAKNRAVLRLSPALTTGWEGIGKQLKLALDDEELQLELLRELAESPEEGADDRVAGWIREAAQAILEDPGMAFEIGRSEIGRRQVSIHLAATGRKALITAEEEGDEVEEESAQRSFLRSNRGLTAHQQGVGERAMRYARELGFDESCANTLQLAGRLHDLGKADERFQSWLSGGVAVPNGAEPLAKSNHRRSDIERARQASGWPKGGRHEMLSLRFAEALGLDRLDGIDRELLLHLIASHHGYCRPFAPVVDDRECRPLTVDFGEIGKLTVSRPAGVERLDSGTAERFWRLNRRFGWYGLAMLESILRLADHRQSAIEERRKS